MKKPKYRSAGINLGSWESGTDLASFIEKNKGDLMEAFEDHAQLLWRDGVKLHKIAKFIEAHKATNFEITAEGMMIFVSSTPEIIEKMILEGLADKEDSVEDLLKSKK